MNTDFVLPNSVYTETTRNIKITVVPEYLAEQSTPETAHYSFAYHVKIENLGDKTVKLLERHWKIFSGGSQIGEVMGPGVIGQQPVLEEANEFSYTSGTEIRDPIGHMEGTYTFEDADGKPFLVTIPRFYLFYPMAIN